MSRFFSGLAFLASVGLLGVVIGGHLLGFGNISPSIHVLSSLIVIFFAIAVHCLVFAILTGSGKDTRLLAEELGLSREYVAMVRRFRKETFPQSLGAILLLLLAACLGGAVSRFPVLGWIHVGLGWFSFLYNIKTYRLECRTVKKNGELISRVNADASRVLPKPCGPVDVQSPELEILEGAVEHYGWEAHVYALGRFLCFLGYNAWLPYLYLCFVVGYFTIPFWPFVLLSLLCFLGGYLLRWRYHAFRPERWREI